jgi:hypothetical protein
MATKFDPLHQNTRGRNSQGFPGGKHPAATKARVCPSLPAICARRDRWRRERGKGGIKSSISTVGACAPEDAILLTLTERVVNSQSTAFKHLGHAPRAQHYQGDRAAVMAAGHKRRRNGVALVVTECCRRGVRGFGTFPIGGWLSRRSREMTIGRVLIPHHLRRPAALRGALPAPARPWPPSLARRVSGTMQVPQFTLV